MGDFETGFAAGLIIGSSNKSGDTPTPEPTPEKWTYPSNWLQLPEPAENQIVMLVDNNGGIINQDTYYLFAPNITYETDTNTTINYGDGTGELPIDHVNTDKSTSWIENIYGHIYEAGSGHNTGNSEQWIVTITFDTSKEIGTEYFYKLINYTYSPTAKMPVLAIKIGHSGYIGNRSNTGSYNLDCSGNLQYAKICHGDFDFYFSYAHYLHKVELHDEITNLPQMAFQNCYGLFDINLDNITEIGQFAFYNCRCLDPSGKMPNLTTIGNQAFAFTGITNLDFPRLETIGSSAFYYTVDFKKITLAPETLTSIGVNTFTNCIALEAVNLPYVTSAGNTAFSSCTNLKTVDLRSCESFGTNVFQTDYNLSKCVLKSGVDITGQFSSCPNVEIEYMEV